MSEINQELKPFFECALKTLECIIENKDEISKMDYRKEPHRALFQTPAGQKICIFNGLCDNITASFEDTLESYLGDPRRSMFFNITEAWASEWPNYSGQTGYPVPMPEHFSLDWDSYSDDELSMDDQTEETKAYAAFHTCDDEEYNMYADDYGQLRLQLAEFWAGKLKEKLKP